MAKFRIRMTIGVVLLCATPTAYSQYSEKIVDALFDHWMAFGDAYGPSAGYYHGGFLEEGLNETFDLLLTPGDYVVVGACDEDCTDVDLVVTGITEAGADRAMDDMPVVMFSVSSEGYFHIRVEMASCAREPCEWAVHYYGPKL